MHGELARRTLMSARGHHHFAEVEGLPLSLKCMFNGRARYQVGRAEFCVDDAGFMILNEGRRYTIEIASPTCVQSFIFWFPRGWAEEVARSLTTATAGQLDSCGASDDAPIEFFSRYIPNDRLVMPRVRAIIAAWNSGQSIENCWLEERLRGVLAALWQTERGFGGATDSLKNARAATREELLRRLQRGRDFLHAQASNNGVSLSKVAEVACLSPFHFLRSFKQAFGLTPHQFLTRCRVDRAKFLLARTALPITDICYDAGFLSLGSFTTLFHRVTGQPPRAWRRAHSCGVSENRKIREVFLTGA